MKRDRSVTKTAVGGASKASPAPVLGTPPATPVAPGSPRAGSAGREDGTPPSGRSPQRSGGQAGNRNAVTHGAYATGNAALNDAKAAERDRRDRHATQAEEDALAILKACGLENDPMGRLVARQIRRLETQAGRFEAFLNSRGSFTKLGDVKPAAQAFMSVAERLLGEARHLLEQLAALRPKSAGDVLYVCTLSDWTPFAPPPSDAVPEIKRGPEPQE